MMSAILEKTDHFISELFKKKLPETCVYHNYDHTKRVFKSTKEILENVEINEEDQEAFIISCFTT